MVVDPAERGEQGDEQSNVSATLRLQGSESAVVAALV